MISRRAIVFIAIGLFLGSSCVLAEEKQLPGLNLGNILNNLLNVSSIIDGLAETALGLVGNVTQLLPKITEMVQSAVGALKLVTSLPLGLGKLLLAPLTAVLDSLLRGVLPIVDALIAQVRDLLAKLPLLSGDELNNATNLIGSLLETIVGILATVASPLVDAVKLQDEVFQNVVAPVLEAVANLIGTVSGLLCDVLNAAIPESLGNTVGQLQETLATLLGSLKLSTCKLSACQSLNDVVDSLTGTINKCNL